MRVLLLNTYPSGGGAAIATARAMEALQARGADVRLLTITGYGYKWQVRFLLERLDTYFAVRGHSDMLFRFSTASLGVNIADHPWVEWAEVIHIQWVQQGFVSLRGIERLLSMEGKRIFWSLHDLWPLTGGCHLPYMIDDSGATSFCHKYKTMCGDCPILRSNSTSDRAHSIFLKKSHLPLSRVHFIAVSNHIKEVAIGATLTRRSQISVVHNPIDIQVFYPNTTLEDEDVARLLFVASNLDDPVKGLDYLRQMLTTATEINPQLMAKVRLYLVGKTKHKEALQGFPIAIEHIEGIDQKHLVSLYQKGTLLLSTSRYETMGQTILEALACGTPSVAFDVGGISDMIISGVNGALVPAYDTRMMAQSVIDWLLKHKEASRREIAKSVAHFSTDVIGTQLMTLYKGSE